MSGSIRALISSTVFVTVVIATAVIPTVIA
jgi:hypothetical protein